MDRPEHIEEDLRHLRELLAQIPQAEPPPALRQAAMAEYDQLFARPPVFAAGVLPGHSGKHVGGRASGASWSETGSNLLKEFIMSVSIKSLLAGPRGKVFAGSVAAAVLLYGISASINFPPDNGQVAGTIAPAQRTQVSQVTATSVKLGDEQIARLTQSDDYRALVKSDAFRELMKNDALLVLMKSADFQALVQNQAFLQMMQKNDAAVADVLKSELFREASLNNAAKVVFSNEAFMQALSREGAGALTSQAYQVAARDAGFMAAMKNDALMTALKNDAFLKALSSEAFREALRSEHFMQAMKSEAFMQMLRSDSFRQVLSNQSAMSVLRADTFKEALKSDSFMQAFKTDLNLIVRQ